MEAAEVICKGTMNSNNSTWNEGSVSFFFFFSETDNLDGIEIHMIKQGQKAEDVASCLQM